MEEINREYIEKISKGSQKITIGVVDNLVVVEMDTLTKWVAFPKEMAIAIGKSLIDKANEILTD